MKLKLLFYLILALSIISCNKTEYVCPINSDGFSAINAALELKNGTLLILDNHGMPAYLKYEYLNSSAAKGTDLQSSGLTTLVGYTSKEKLSSGKLVFTSQPDDKRLQANTYYLYDTYCYKYKITVSHGATVIVPQNFDSSWKTGNKPSNEDAIGYELSDILSSSAQGDTYELRTIIREVAYNLSGQYLGFTAYLPFRVGNPATDLIFKYKEENIEWDN